MENNMPSVLKVNSMSRNERPPIVGDQGVLNVPGNYQPVHLEDTFGTLFLGIFAIISLIG